MLLSIVMIIAYFRFNKAGIILRLYPFQLLQTDMGYLLVASNKITTLLEFGYYFSVSFIGFKSGSVSQNIELLFRVLSEQHVLYRLNHTIKGSRLVYPKLNYVFSDSILGIRHLQQLPPSLRV
jgi:hypothetical protein